MTSRNFGENTVVQLTPEDVERLSNEPRKVFYQYESDATLEPSQNMSPERVAQTVTALRAAFDAELARDPDFSVATLKQRLRSDPATDCFATQHPRIFDTVLSKFSGPKEIELVLHMVRFRTAVDQGLLTENQAKATLNELLIGHYKRPEGTDREKMADQRIERKVLEGSFLGFDPASIHDLLRAAAAATAINKI